MHIDTHFFWVPRCKITSTQYLLSFMPELPGRMITSTVATPSPSTISSVIFLCFCPCPTSCQSVSTQAISEEPCTLEFLHLSYGNNGIWCWLLFHVLCTPLSPGFLLPLPDSPVSSLCWYPFKGGALGVGCTGNSSLAVSNWQLIQD